MATLRYFSADGAPKLLPVHKPLMVIGRGSGEAYQLALSGQGIVVVQASEGHPVPTAQ